VTPPTLATGTATTARRRRSLSLRGRLLIGLIGLTAIFLVVMGVVSSLVLGHLEQKQFNSELEFAARQPITAIAKGAGGFSAAYLSPRTGDYGELTPSTGSAVEMSAYLGTLAGKSAAQVDDELRARAAQDQPFDLTVGGQPTLRVVWRTIASVGGTSAPLGRNFILVGRPVSDISSQVSGLVIAELITGGALLALLAACGSWLIGGGLAPLNRMAKTADLITSNGDLTARMSDPDDRQEIGRLAGAINTMLDRIQQAFGARLRSEQKVRQFAADASHELRTPLTTIRGYAELYRQGALGPGELPNAMRRIEQEADRMSRLVAELLELARLDRESSLDLTETDLAALAVDAVADARAVEPDRPVNADVPPSLVATADEPRIRQVLANLLGNVRAHTPPGTPVIVRVFPSGGGAVLEVSDAGPGMAPQDAARAFDRFHRGARGGGADDPPAANAGAGSGSGSGSGSGAGSGTGGSTGSGLGLSIVQAIAAAHGGYARLRTAPGAGTTVHLWIPVHFAGPRGAPR
jgi:signal transduction histidine kinase